MIAVIDARSPKEAIENLAKYCDNIFLFKSENITYESISGHPDIFIFQDENNTILAPNSPKELILFLENNSIDFSFGKTSIGGDLKASTPYNCIASSKYLFHKKGFTDKTILDLHKNKIFVDLPQAYTACSLIHLSNKHYITSDLGIQKSINQQGLICDYFSPEKISIVRHKYGFLGGTHGRIGDKLFFNGNIDLHKDAEVIRNVAKNNGFEIISLHDNYLYDGGKIFFWE